MTRRKAVTVKIGSRRPAWAPAPGSWPTGPGSAWRGRPTPGADPSPPTSRRCNKAPSFGIGRSLAPWIIRRRYGPQPDEQAACAFNLIYMWKRLAGRPAGGAGASPPTSTRCKAPSFGIGQSLAAWIIRPRYGPQPDEQAACALDVEAPGGSTRTRGWRWRKSTHQHAL